MTLSRRSFFTGLATLIAAPAIVRAESLMKLAPTRIISPTTLIITDYPINMDVTRLDVLYGSMRVRPEWTALIPDITLDECSLKILAPMINRLAQNVSDAVMYGQSVAKYDLAGIHSISLSELLVEAREGHQFA